MSNIENQEQPQEKKKLSLAEVMRQQLASKKQGQTQGKAMGTAPGTTKQMKSQQTKKPNNQRRRTGV